MDPYFKNLADIVRDAADLIDRAGIADMLTTWMEEDEPSAPPASISPRTLFIAWVTLAFEGTQLSLSAVTQLLHARLTLKTALAVGILEARDVPAEVLYREVTIAMKRMLACIDYTPLPAGDRVLTKSEYEAAAEARTLDSNTLATKRARNLRLTGALLQAQFDALPESVRKERISISLDSQFRSANTRGLTRREYGSLSDDDLVSAEPDAGFFMPIADGVPRGESAVSAYGWECQVATLVSNEPARFESVPHIAVAIASHKPGHLPSAVGQVVGSVFDRGLTLEHVVGNLAYFPTLRPERLQNTLRERGAKLVMEYAAHHEGHPQAVAGDAILVEGGWYRSDLPDHLRTAMSDFRTASRENRTPDGSRVIDPLSQQDLEERRDALLAARRPFEVAAPSRASSQATKCEQHYKYGSTQWTQVYSGGRHANKLFATDFKRFSDILTRTPSSLSGEVGHGFVTALIILATNAHRIAEWTEAKKLDVGNGLLSDEWYALYHAVVPRVREGMAEWSRQNQPNGMKPVPESRYWNIDHDEDTFDWVPDDTATMITMHAADDATATALADALVEDLRRQADSALAQMESMNTTADYADLSQVTRIRLRFSYLGVDLIDEEEHDLPLPNDGVLLGAEAILVPSAKLSHAVRG